LEKVFNIFKVLYINKIAEAHTSIHHFLSAPVFRSIVAVLRKAVLQTTARLGNYFETLAFFFSGEWKYCL
jgi:hypothetical protein